MAFFEVDGKQLYYEVQGEGHPLVLIHSALMESGMYDAQIKAFSAHCRVIRYDLYGYGRSAFTEQKIVDHGKDLQALLGFLKVDKACILGTSMGAEIALGFVLDYPALADGLIMVGGALDEYDYPADAMKWWDDFMDAIREGDFKQGIKFFVDGAIDSATTPLSPELRASIENRMSNYNFRHYLDNTLLWPSPEQPAARRLGSIQCPTLVMVGAGDTPLMGEMADVLAKNIPGAKKVVVPGAAHLVNLQQPEAFEKVVLDFMGQVAG